VTVNDLSIDDTAGEEAAPDALMARVDFADTREVAARLGPVVPVGTTLAAGAVTWTGEPLSIRSDSTQELFSPLRTWTATVDAAGSRLTRAVQRDKHRPAR